MFEKIKTYPVFLIIVKKVFTPSFLRCCCIRSKSRLSNRGSDWCMPTVVQFQELIDKCTCIWTSRNGQNGYEVKGPNNKTIFIPAVSAYEYSDGGLHNDGLGGMYWSSSLCTDFPDCAQVLQLASLNPMRTFWGIYRIAGLPVRPVRCKK